MVSLDLTKNRQKEQPVKVPVMIRLTLSAEDVEEEHSIDKRRYAAPADSQAKKCESMWEQTAKCEQEREKAQEA